MEDIKIKINQQTREVDPNRIFIGLDGENLQGNIIFSFEDKFVDGQARLEVEFRDGTKGQITELEKVNETYVMPIKSEITKYSGCKAQLVITEGTNENSIPIFKSLYVGLIVEESINASTPIPEGYTEWIDSANVKLNEMDTLNLDANKEGKITAIVITRKDGTQKIVEVLDGIDGVGLNYIWNGTSLGVKREDEQSYNYVNLKGDRGEPGSIKYIVVQELPTTGIEEDAMYLVPITPDEQDNNFKEYIYVNGNWELLGKIAVHVDLTDYYTKTETNNLLDTKNPLIDSTHKLSSDLVDDTNATNKFFSGNYNDLTNKPTIPTVPTNVSAFTNDANYTTKTYVDGLVGDINTALDTINGEVI